MTAWIFKFTLVMLHAVVLVVSDIYQSVVTRPPVTMYYALWVHFTADNALQRLFLRIGNNFGIHFAAAFEDTEYDGFTSDPTTAFTWNSFGTKVRFIHFDGASQWGFWLSYSGDAHNSSYGSTAMAGQLGAVSGRKYLWQNNEATAEIWPQKFFNVYNIY